MARCGSDITGLVTGTLLAFLKTPSLPVYYKMKTYLVLSGADEGDEPHDNFWACHHYLREAEKALEECRSVYVHVEDDNRVLTAQERVIKGEWDDLRKREKEADSSYEED